MSSLSFIFCNTSLIFEPFLYQENCPGKGFAHIEHAKVIVEFISGMKDVFPVQIGLSKTIHTN